MSLRLEGPVELWDEAIPLGNGHLGGLLYGDGSVIKLALDCGSLWDERKSPAVLRKDFTWKHWLELKAAGRWDEIGEIFDRPYWEPTPTKIPGGRLDIVLALGSMAESSRPEKDGGGAAITPQQSEAATTYAQRDRGAGACSHGTLLPCSFFSARSALAGFCHLLLISDKRSPVRVSFKN
jgi:hypothetical protein